MKSAKQSWPASLVLIFFVATPVHANLEVVSAGNCLSLPKFSEELIQAKEAAGAPTNIEVVEDGSPVSDAFVGSLFTLAAEDGRLQAMKEGDLWSPIEKKFYQRIDFKSGGTIFRISQPDCSTFWVQVNDCRPQSFKFVVATPTRLVSEPFSSCGEPEGSLEFLLESPSQMKVRMIRHQWIESRTPSCDRVRESHTVITEGIFQFGDSLGAPPALSGSLAKLLQIAQGYWTPERITARRKYGSEDACE